MVFVQVISGQTADPGGARAAFAGWRPRIPGLLAATAGVADGGRFVVIVRSEDEATGAEDVGRRVEGPLTVRGSADIEVLGAGVPAAAGFLEVIEGRTADRARFMALERRIEVGFRTERPDFLGSFLLWWPDGAWLEIASFTSEAEARAGDDRPLPAELARLCAEWDAVAGASSQLDLRDVWWIAP